MVEFRIYLKVIKVKFSPWIKQQQHINNFYHAHKRNLFSKKLEIILWNLPAADYINPCKIYISTSMDFFSSFKLYAVEVVNISATHMHLGVMLGSLHIHSSVSDFWRPYINILRLITDVKTIWFIEHCMSGLMSA